MAHFLPAIGEDVVGEAAQGGGLLRRVGHDASASQDDHAAVVDGMVEGGAGEHESVHQGDSDANVEPVAERVHHTAGGGTVEEDLVAGAGVAGGNDVRLAGDGEADVADEALVEDGVDCGLVVHAALREAAHGGASGGRKSVHSLSTVSVGGQAGRPAGRPVLHGPRSHGDDVFDLHGFLDDEGLAV